MTNGATDREEEIIKLFRQGDPLAMNRLYDDHAGYLTGVCARYISRNDELKDVLQESFIKIFTQIGSFEYRGRGSLRAWMSRIVVNESLQALRKAKRQPATVPDTEPPDVPDESPDESDLDGMNGEDITRLIRRLPEGYRMVLNLYVIEGKSHNEIASLLGIKPDSSASQLHRAKNMLARLIKTHRKKHQDP